jgi:hypothetical protein
METKNSDIDVFFLVRVVEKVEKLESRGVFEEWGVELRCERHSAALKVVRLFPSSRGSQWTFCDDTQKRGPYVPSDLLRVGDLSNNMKTTQLTSGIGARTRSRCAVDVIGGGSAGEQASCYYEVVDNKARKAISQLAAPQARPWLHLSTCCAGLEPELGTGLSRPNSLNHALAWPR